MNRISRLLLFLAALAIFAGCDSSSETESHPPGSDTLDNVIISPHKLDFGKVLVGTYTVMKVLIINNSNTTKSMTVMGPADGSAFTVEGSIVSFQLDSHSTRIIELKYSPQEKKEDSAYTTITDASGGSARVSLHGVGADTLTLTEMQYLYHRFAVNFRNINAQIDNGDSTYNRLLSDGFSRSDNHWFHLNYSSYDYEDDVSHTSTTTDEGTLFIERVTDSLCRITIRTSEERQVSTKIASGSGSYEEKHTIYCELNHDMISSPPSDTLTLRWNGPAISQRLDTLNSYRYGFYNNGPNNHSGYSIRAISSALQSDSAEIIITLFKN
jgi:hypothetical protein